MKEKDKAMTLILQILFSLIYTFVYLILTFGSLGGGHGTTIFLAPVFTWFLLFIALFLSNRADTLFKRIVFIILMLSHYAHTFLFLSPLITDEIFQQKQLFILKKHIGGFLFTLGWYLAGQAIIWIMFLSNSKVIRSLKNDHYMK
jgi:hypothetical protein